MYVFLHKLGKIVYLSIIKYLFIICTYGAIFAKPTSSLNYLSDFCYTTNFCLLGSSDLTKDRKSPWMSR